MFEVQTQTDMQVYAYVRIIVRHLVTSPFKTMHFQIVYKNHDDQVNLCHFTKLKR